MLEARETSGLPPPAAVAHPPPPSAAPPRAAPPSSSVVSAVAAQPVAARSAMLPTPAARPMPVVSNVTTASAAAAAAAPAAAPATTSMLSQIPATTRRRLPSTDAEIPKWLFSLGLAPTVAEEFHRQGVDMEALPLLSRSDLPTLGVTGVGSQLKMMKDLGILRARLMLLPPDNN